MLVLRPDKFVFGVTDGQSDELTRALVAQLGLEHPASARRVARWRNLEVKPLGSRHPGLSAVGEVRNLETSGPSSSAEVSSPRWPSS